ncbi:hypothetical protein NKG94_14455 [Micromonospora sp. M12]
MNPFAGVYLTDPASMWRRILDDPDGVNYAEDLGLWLISRHAHVRQALADAATFANGLTLVPVYEVCPAALNVIMQIDAPPTTAAADPPAHPRTPPASGQPSRTPPNGSRPSTARSSGVGSTSWWPVSPTVRASRWT